MRKSLMTKESYLRKRYSIYNKIPQNIKDRLMDLHSLIEEEVGEKLLTYEFRLKRYMKSIKKTSFNNDEILNKIIAIVEKELRPVRNEQIKEVCRRAYLPDSKFISPCGLKCNLKFPCYECDFSYDRFSKRFEKASNEEVEEIFENEFLFDIEYIEC